MMPEKPVVYFMHIPKTAGTTFIDLCLHQYLFHEIFHVRPHLIQYDLDLYRQLPVEKKEKLRFVYGHYPFGLHSGLTSPILYLTFLRHPVDRVLSEFTYRQTEQGGMHYQENRKESLAEFLSGPHFHDNKYVRLLSGNPSVNILDGSGTVTEDDLERAMQNIDTFFPVVGITEHFDESLFCLENIMGWSVLPYNSKKVNPNKSNPEESSIRQQISDQNRLDEILYDYCKNKLKSQINRFNQTEVNRRIRGYHLSLVKRVKQKLSLWQQ